MKEPETLDEMREALQEALGSRDEDWWERVLMDVLRARYRRLRGKVFDVSTVGARLRTARTWVGLSLPSLAARVLMNPGRLAAYEAGKWDIAGDHFVAICRALRIAPAWALGESEEGGPPIPAEQQRKHFAYDPKRIADKRERRRQREAEAEAERLRAKYRRPAKEVAGGSPKR